uniref:NLR family CARD domain-containing protein 3-like isoform X1 n=2 Tax=Geotrypetes seraphini TaxID=260995 RepID=A0A6P8N4Z9_GEOSA|nr:NLR family CARD domain-containing protein 3-like isoform X1 [Geotrypetes seraphini]XP_033770546.1 NLR family CARD domain-containing protein 3-like isoform X1 [Geotrypetes seraphini]XP_033770547.1 NLR family CARD domain-containing protein 3-like isoform X1 [Geotrypetes seraphini]
MAFSPSSSQLIQRYREDLGKWLQNNPELLLRWLYDHGVLSQAEYFTLLEKQPKLNQVVSLLELVSRDKSRSEQFLQVLCNVQDNYCSELQHWLEENYSGCINPESSRNQIQAQPGNTKIKKSPFCWLKIKSKTSKKYQLPEQAVPDGGGMQSTNGRRSLMPQLKVLLQSHKRSLLNRTSKIQGNTEDSSSCCHIEIRYTELFITTDDLSQTLSQHEYFSLANRRARIYEHNRYQKIPLKELLSPLPFESQKPHKILISGIAGIGKSVAMQKVLSEWAMGVAFRNYVCIMDFTFRELNLIENNISFISLTQSKHAHLEQILQQLFDHPEEILIVLDGLDEFRHSLDFTSKSGCTKVDQLAHVNDLVCSLLKGTLLGGASIIVTTRPNIIIPPEVFDRNIIILGFEEQQVEEYCLRFFRSQELSKEVFEYIVRNDNLSGLSFIPLYCFIICTALSEFFRGETQSSFCDSPPKTITEVYRCYLCTIIQHHMHQESLGGDMENPPKLCSPAVLRAMKDVLFQLGKLAYYTLLSNKILFYESDLQDFGFDANKLPTSFLSKIFISIKDQKEVEMFSFFHMTVQEHLAALYCVMAMSPKPADLVVSLNLWCFGIIPQETINNELISITKKMLMGNRWENLQMFTRFFMGLLCCRIEGKLEGLVDGLSRDTLQLLAEWFKEKVRYEANQKFLNLLHCLRELQQKIVVEEVAPEIDEINLFKVTLNPVDCSALFYVLQHSNRKLKTLNLGYTNMGIQGLRRLQPLLHRCETLYLRYNSLNKEAAIMESDVLRSPDCQVKSLLMCGNCIGSEGVRSLWEALQFNSTLEELYMDITGITDRGLDNMLPCLLKNSTLRIMTIVGNKFSKAGKRQLIELCQRKPGLKIISSFVDDMGLLQAYLDWVEEIKADPEQMESVKNADALRSILVELEQTDNQAVGNDIQERVGELRTQIKQLLQCSMSKEKGGG